MPIENRNLEPGTRLVATYKKETYHALVVAGDDGKVRYHLSPYDGQEYKSPSALGTAVTGKPCNGWTFWSVDTSAAEGEQNAPEDAGEAEEIAQQGQELEEEAEDATPSEAEEEAPEPQAATFRRVPNQRGVPQGEVRLYCDACSASFTAPVDQQPDTCPQGHWPGEAPSTEDVTE